MVSRPFLRKSLWKKAKFKRNTNKSLQLSLFSMMLAVDFALGFIGPAAVFVSWFIAPEIYVLCGRNKMLVFYGIGMLESLPNSLGSGQATLTTTLAAKQSGYSVSVPPSLVPLIKTLEDFNNSYFVPISHAIGYAWFSIPWEIRFVIAGASFYFVIRWEWDYWIGTAEKILNRIPSLISWGLIPYVEALVFSEDLEYRWERQVRRRMLGKRIDLFSSQSYRSSGSQAFPTSEYTCLPD